MINHLFRGKPWYSDSALARFLLWGHKGAYRCLPFVPWLGIIVIHPDYPGDAGLLEHELVHREQHKSYPFSFVIRVLFCPKFRLWTEVDAYAKQTIIDGVTPERIDYFAQLINQGYHLNYPYDYIVERLYEAITRRQA